VPASDDGNERTKRRRRRRKKTTTAKIGALCQLLLRPEERLGRMWTTGIYRKWEEGKKDERMLLLLLFFFFLCFPPCFSDCEIDWRYEDYYRFFLF
jgi:hypothetical protein